MVVGSWSVGEGEDNAFVLLAVFPVESTSWRDVGVISEPHIPRPRPSPHNSPSKTPDLFHQELEMSAVM